MTNTRITDPEILERRLDFTLTLLLKPILTTTNECVKTVCRYPVILRCFHLNSGTGGSGQYRGGDGVKRELLFRRQLKLSVLTERRIHHPYGLDGNHCLLWHSGMITTGVLDRRK